MVEAELPIIRASNEKKINQAIAQVRVVCQIQGAKFRPRANAARCAQAPTYLARVFGDIPDNTPDIPS